MADHRSRADSLFRQIGVKVGDDPVEHARGEIGAGIAAAEAIDLNENHR